MSVANTSNNAMEPQRDREGTLLQVVETLLDKGLVLNADIMVSVAGVELLGIRIRAALASFETAARYGLDFPAGTDRETVAWKEAIEQKDTCPQCGKRAELRQLMNEYCPWCGWQSARSKELSRQGSDQSLSSKTPEQRPEDFSSSGLQAGE
ncbi:gas vesicle protein [Rothia uropygialis]|uniref:gas vesicle protein n=1 Tax=Kocuria sp. 36 TaxID=1415402 RepID=UPI00237B0961|nr:gas vesicle protein [Kocuria sp. 36]